MTLAELLIVLGLAFLLSLLLAGALGWRRYPGAPMWPTVIFILLILFPVLWLADLWLRPAGPAFVGVYWVPLLVVGLILILILAAVTPPRRRTVIEVGETPTEAAVTATFGLFFWILLIVLVIAVIAAYAAT